jgi:hypothetical protein
MKRIWLKIGLFCFILLLISPNTTCVQSNPDLAITDIYVKDMILKSDELYFTVKNVGDWTVLGVRCRVVIERLLFNTIAIRTIASYIASTWPDDPPLFPGSSLNFRISTPKIIIPGFYMIHVHPNPDIFESNYDISRYEKFFSIGFVFQNWIQCY